MRLPKPDSLAIRDGERVRADELSWGWDDPAFHFGMGLFETLAVRGSKLIDSGAHLERLGASAQALGWNAIPEQEFVSALDAVAASCGPSGWVKLMLSAGERWCVLGGPSAEDSYQVPVRAGIYPHIKGNEPSQQLKMLSYAAHSLAYQWAQGRGLDEAIWVNAKGHLLEGSRSNLFVLRGKSLFTPPLSAGVLPGTVRRRVLEAAATHGVSVHQDKLRIPRVRNCDVAFVTNALGGLRPLIELDGCEIGRRRERLEPLQRRVESLRGVSR